jgi:hypothetical protein
VLESERWHLVARRVANGEAFSTAVDRVFGCGAMDTRGADWAPWNTDEREYENLATLYALLLAEDAADEENETFASGGATPYVDGQPFTPIHITYCAEDPPMPAVFVGPEPEQDEPEVLSLIHI